MDLLLHLTSPAQWRGALSVGSLAPASLVTDGFVHLSASEQVALPANRLVAGRDNVLLLVVDPGRLRDELRLEPGVPTDPASMEFPHLYGPLPTEAVTSVVPYRPGPSGSFEDPVDLPAPSDRAGRARAFDPSLVQRRAAAVLPVAGGFAVLDPRVPASYEHNCLWVSAPVSAHTVVDEADRTLASLAHRRVVFDGEAPSEGLAWNVEEFRLMLLDPGAPPPAASMAPVSAVTSDVIARLWRRSWRRQLTEVPDAVIDDLVRREPLTDAFVRVIDLAVLGDDETPMAGAQLRIDGATASIEAVLTEPGHRGKGYAAAVVGAAIDRAKAAGCDVVFLSAAADDWPRHWYARLGFVDVGPRWEATLA
ncbi:MAG: GNAT family N-acetyltransferase [Acidimicrobiia bacterium]|nr:GNAT family N-acetyltransferase [Acidimicrobiia bacterium]